MGNKAPYSQREYMRKMVMELGLDREMLRRYTNLRPETLNTKSTQANFENLSLVTQVLTELM